MRQPDDHRPDRDLERRGAGSRRLRRRGRGRRPSQRSIIRRSIVPRSRCLQDARLSGIDFRLFDPRELLSRRRPPQLRLPGDGGQRPFSTADLSRSIAPRPASGTMPSLIRGASFYLGGSQHRAPRLFGGLERSAALLGEVFLRRGSLLAAMGGDARLRGLSRRVPRRGDHSRARRAPSRRPSMRSSPPSPSTPSIGAQEVAAGAEV